MGATSGSGTLRLLILALATAAASSGCAWLDTNVERGYTERGHWSDDQPRVYTTADIRMIVQRQHPLTKQMVTCTEPTPDVAKALSTAGAFTAQGSSKAGASGQLGASGGSAEAVAELAGRSTALIALRDGLYRTCEAYLNGAIGSDAYALVLSRYGHLMTTLFLGEDIRGAVALSNTTPPTSPTLITVTPNSGPAVQVQKGDSTTSGTSPGDGDSQQAKGTKSSSTVSVAPEFLKVGSSNGNNSKSPQGNTPPADTSDNAGSDGSSDSGKKQQAAADGSSGTPASAPAVAAVSLVRMNKDYIDLDINVLHQLVVACINEFDLTRVRDNRENTWLRGVCASINDVQKMVKTEQALASAIAVAAHPAPNVKPDLALGAQASATANGSQNSPPPVKKKTAGKGDVSSEKTKSQALRNNERS